MADLDSMKSFADMASLFAHPTKETREILDEMRKYANEINEGLSAEARSENLKHLEKKAEERERASKTALDEAKIILSNARVEAKKMLEDSSRQIDAENARLRERENGMDAKQAALEARASDTQVEINKRERSVAKRESAVAKRETDVSNREAAVQAIVDRFAAVNIIVK